MSLSELQEHLRSPPFHQLFDLSCVRFDRDAGELEILMRYTPSVERSAGTRQYHGGPIASLIDIAGDYALWAMLGYGVPTINLRIDYLRPAAGTDLKAVARVRRAGRTVGVVDIDVIDDQGRV
ncbi:MAG: PaaI family thioesterase, partial [Gammaproteobacteria bacterium]|nr:PaaI family thioesterase [Gammaproteobacteria bacterium]